MLKPFLRGLYDIREVQFATQPIIQSINPFIFYHLTNCAALVSLDYPIYALNDYLCYTIHNLCTQKTG